MKKNKFYKIAFFAIYLLLSTITLGIVIDYFFWRNYVANLPFDSKNTGYPNYDKSSTSIPRPLAHDIGYFIASEDHRGFSSSPSGDFPTRKKNTLRIGAFGDSFTYGSEVVADLNYTSLLKRRLSESGIENIEIYNFGTPDHGFHQAYRLWEQWGQKANLDLILLGPGCFCLDRDVTFNHSENNYYIHGKYVIKNEQLVYIRPVGTKDFVDRFEAYFKFIPEKEYLFYDRKPPAFLRALLPKNRTINNPFYYTSKPEKEEIYEIYAQMFFSMAQKNPVVFLKYWDTEIADLANGNGAQIQASLVPFLREFPYGRPAGHDSGIGNDFLAHAFFEVLQGKTKLTLPYLRMTAPDKSVNQKHTKDTFDLGQFDKGEILIGSRSIGFLVTDDFKRANFKTNHISALFSIFGSEWNFVDYPLLPLEKPLSSSDEIFYSAKTDKENFNAKFENLKQVHQKLPVFGINSPGVSIIKRNHMPPQIVLDSNFFASLNIFDHVKEFNISLNNNELLFTMTVKSGNNVLVPIHSPVFASAEEDSYVDVEKLPSEGELTLRLSQARSTRDIVFGAWRKQNYEIELSHPLAKAIDLTAYRKFKKNL